MEADRPRNLRRWIWVAMVSFVVAIYVGSYITLRTRSIAEASPLNFEGFLYVPLNDVMASHDLSTHYFLSYVFAPLNYVDRALFGGPGPVRCILFDLS